jgi:CubicO group peptidase (beta-lactamase class C family)
VVENLRATSFEAAVATHVGGPLGATRIARARTDSAATPENARYRNPALTTALSNLTADRPLVPIQYGAEPLEIADASGGMAAALPDLAKVLASLNVREGNPVLSATAIDRLLAGHYGLDRSVRNGGAWHAWKGGLLMGSQANVNFTQDGTSYVVAWGSNGVNDENDPSWTWFPEFPALDAAIASTTWSDVDRFPELGIPSF